VFRGGRRSAARFRGVGGALWEVHRLLGGMFWGRDRHRAFTGFRLGVVELVLVYIANYLMRFCSFDYGLDDRTGGRFPEGAGNFSLRHRVHTDSGAHPASYAVGTGGSFPGGNAAGREADHSPPSSAEVK
jgi:hypothetical protein